MLYTLWFLWNWCQCSPRPFSEADGTPKDPMWIGCWWSGFAACAVLIVIAVIPMWFFPRSMSSSPSQPIGKTNRMEAKGKIGSALGQFKGGEMLRSNI